jgi:hypothetical protein
MLSRLIESVVAALRRLFGSSTATTPTAASPKLLSCPNTKEERAVQPIGPEGGTLKIGDHQLVVPPGGVPDKVSFSAILLSDKLLKVRLQANDADTFKFSQSASLTLSYGRCEPPADAQRLRVYRIDPLTDAVLKELGGTVDTGARTVTARLDSLSTYTLGTPTDRPSEGLP